MGAPHWAIVKMHFTNQSWAYIKMLHGQPYMAMNLSVTLLLVRVCGRWTSWECLLDKIASCAVLLHHKVNWWVNFPLLLVWNSQTHIFKLISLNFCKSPVLNGNPRGFGDNHNEEMWRDFMSHNEQVWSDAASDIWWFK